MSEQFSRRRSKDMIRLKKMYNNLIQENLNFFNDSFQTQKIQFRIKESCRSETSRDPTLCLSRFVFINFSRERQISLEEATYVREEKHESQES